MNTRHGWTIYLWEPCLSPHKTDLHKALRDSGCVDRIVTVAAAALQAERQASGWFVEDLPSDECVLAPTDAYVEDIIENAPHDAVHIFSGMHNPPMIVKAIRLVIRGGRRFGFMHEPRASEGVKGALRFLHSRASEGQLRDHADFVLAIGRNGPPWFARVGFDRAKIFPFAYFLPYQATSRNKPAPRPRVNYLGRLTREKGLWLFLDSLALIRNAVDAEVAGAGPLAPVLREHASVRAGRARYRGVLSMNDVPAFLADTDVLVVPSITKDGWGAVISEALLQGAGVIASNRVGGSVCLDEDWRGRVVTRLRPRDFASAVDDMIESNQLDDICRRRRAQWARERLTGVAGAKNLLAILSHVYNLAPRPPAFYG
jgi:glycosyltransferase involved in cell wall biosynthesis